MPPQPVHQRWFYSLASLTLLVLTVVGFRYFYLHLQAFPGRPPTLPIRTVSLVHGVLHWLSAFVVTLALGLVLLVVKGALERRFGRWFAGTLAMLAAVCGAASLGAKTSAWVRFAEVLVG